MASIFPLKQVINNINNYQIVDTHTIQFNPPMLGGPFILRRVFGGHTFALAYYGLKLLVNDEIHLSTIHLNLFRAGDSSLPMIIKLKSSNSRIFFEIEIHQKDKLIGLSKIRLVPSNNHLLKSLIKPVIYPIPKNVDEYRKITDMKLIATHPEVGKIADKRYNNEWLFELRPLDWNHFGHQNKDKKCHQTFCKLDKVSINDDLIHFDPVIVLLLLSDFHMFQDVISVHKKFNQIDQLIGGSTMNFSANFYDISSIQPYTQFYMETELNVFAHDVSFIPGKIFDMNGQCLMTFCQENFRMTNPIHLQ